MANLWMDLRFALRTLIKNPAFSITAVLALTLAIGANTSVFSVVNALNNFSLPFDQPEQVAFVFPTQPEQNVNQGGLSPAEFREYQDGLTGFESLHATLPMQYNLVGSAEPLRASANQVTPGFFTMTGRAPILGRGFLPEEGLDGNHRVVILDHGFWTQDLGAQPGIVGTTLKLDGDAYRVVGIAPEKFSFGRPVQLWTPLVLDELATPRDQRFLAAIGRLKPDSTAEQTTQEAKVIAARLESTYPDVYRGWSSQVVTVSEVFSQGSGLITILLYSAITFVLLIACANIANLLLSRTLARSQELALRSSLGAGRGQLVRQLLVESLVLAGIGGGLGLALGSLGVRLLRNAFAPDPNIGFVAQNFQLDQTVILHSITISVIAGLIFGILPALRATRGNLGMTLREGAKSSGGKKKQLLRGVLVSAEVALAMALLITAGTLMRAFNGIYSEDPGFRSEGVITAQVGLPEQDYPDDAAVTEYFRAAIQRLEELPGVTKVAATSSLPLTLFPGPGTTHVDVEGRDQPEDATAANAIDVIITPEYFETLEIPLVRGRNFSVLDRSDTEQVAIVTESFVQQHWPGEVGLDRRIRVIPPQTDRDSITAEWRRIVGVVANHESHAHSLRSPIKSPQIFLAIEQAPRRQLTFLARSNAAPAALAPALRTGLFEVDPNLPLNNVKSYDRVVAEIDTQNGVFLGLLSGLAGVALLLAAVGIYGVIAYGVTQRRREIGIRTALGAKPRNTIGLVARSAGWLTGIGLVVGSALGLVLVRLMGSQLEGIASTGASGPTTFLALALLFLTIAMVASLVPTRRALKTNLANVLRDG